MKRILAVLALVAAVAVVPVYAAVCIGADPCKACKNCTECKLCNSGAGSCSIKREVEDRKYEEAQRKRAAAKKSH